ncbi:MAG: phosphatidylglycerophosphatase A [Elusimicrobia bacterium]|nr:phosphatidylglycerophosphatase A [Elusimicrobiota bacterium]
MKEVIKFIATGFGISKIAPHPGEGTVGTLVGIAIFVIWPDSRNFPVAYWLLLVIGMGVGIFVSGKAEEIFGEKDCPLIVIDEIIGYLFAMAFLPKKFWIIVIAFIIFRIIDGIKIKPIKAVEKLNGGIGVMLDDFIAGIITNIIMQLISWRFF